MKIRWLGHASFLLQAEDGKRIITDPFDTSVGYPVKENEADIVTVSHDHFDHNYISAIKGNPQVIRSAGEHNIAGVIIKGLSAFHDASKGSQRGKNIIFSIAIDGMNVVHLGDLGHTLDEAELKEIGKVDILLIPVGGFFTINFADADEVVRQIKPRIAIPMHYKTSAISFPIDGVERFLDKKKNVRYTRCAEVDIIKEKLPESTEIWVMEY